MKTQLKGSVKAFIWYQICWTMFTKVRDMLSFPILYGFVAKESVLMNIHEYVNELIWIFSERAVSRLLIGADFVNLRWT